VVVGAPTDAVTATAGGGLTKLVAAEIGVVDPMGRERIIYERYAKRERKGYRGTEKRKEQEKTGQNRTWVENRGVEKRGEEMGRKYLLSGLRERQERLQQLKYD
jgi:hypothetical protein